MPILHQNQNDDLKYAIAPPRISKKSDTAFPDVSLISMRAVLLSFMGDSSIAATTEDAAFSM